MGVREFMKRLLDSICDMPQEQIKKIRSLQDKGDWCEMSKYSKLSEFFIREVKKKLIGNRFLTIKRCQKISFTSFNMMLIGKLFQRIIDCQKIFLVSLRKKLTGLIFSCVKNCPNLSSENLRKKLGGSGFPKIEI